MRLGLTVCLVIGGNLLAGWTPVWADGLVRDGVGPISTARGGTNLAHADNGAVLLDNPAGLVNFEGCGFIECGVDTLVPDIEYNDLDPNSVSNKSMPLPIPYGSYVRKSADGRWAAGLGFYAPAGFSAEYDMVNPIFGPQEYRSLGGLGKVLPGVAYRVTDRLSVGATLGMGISHIDLEGPFFLQLPPLTGVPTLFDLKVTGITPTWSVGLQYQLTPDTVFGVAYVSESRFTLDGNLKADVYGLAPVPLSSEFDAEMSIVWPRSIGAGITHRLHERHRISADVLWFDWSDAFDQMDLTLTNSTNPLFTTLLGPTIHDRIPFNWRDTVSLRLGYEFFRSAADVIRAGYVYHRRAAPDSTLNPYTDGILEHAVAVGYGRSFGNWALNVAYQFSFGQERRVEQSDLAGGDFDNSRLKAQAQWFSVSVSRRF